MKRLLYTITALSITGTLFAQQNLGVDQPNPQAKIHITNTSGQNSMIVEDEASDATPFVIDSDGNMGVKTATPVTDLDVNGGIEADSIRLTNGASDGAILQSDAGGNAAWREMNIAVYREVYADGTHGGAMLATTWKTRTLNNTQFSLGTAISRVGNVITLQLGMYKINASVPAYKTDGHQIALYDLVNGTYVMMGTTEYAESYATNPVDGSNRSSINGILVVTATTSYEIRHYSATAQTKGMGYAVPNGEVEIYAEIMIEKIK